MMDTKKLRRFSRNVQWTLAGVSTRSSGLVTPTATKAGSQKRTFTPSVYLSSSKQVGALKMALRLVGGGESGGFPIGIPIPTFWEFQLEMRSCTLILIKTVYLLLP